VNQKPDDFVRSLESWAIETVGLKVQEIREAIKVLAPEDELHRVRTGKNGA
jgi:hypothetical protein